MNTPDAEAPVLETRSVSKKYGSGANRFQALTDVSLAVNRGEALAIVGKSGSGKSTLMHILATLDAADSGDLLVDGAPTRGLSRGAINALRNRMFGFVFQQFFLTPAATVLDNVTLPLTIAGVPAAERRRRGLEVLERVDLVDKARNRAVDLSGGQKQRTVVARALINDPSVIFADEPTGNLDSATGSVVEDELFALNADKGITLVIVTHDEQLAARCDRQIAIRDGRIDEKGAVA